MQKFLGRVTADQLGDKEAAQCQLRAWQPRHPFLCCFDVDGHLLDNMTAKQVLIFQPHLMDIFGLREIETFYRLHAEYHNLWSRTRGCDRHEAVSLTLGSLPGDRALKPQLGVPLAGKLRSIKTSLDGYIEHVRSAGGAYGFDSLHAYQQAHPDDPDLTRFCIWSKAVDLTFSFVTIPMPPFPNVKETLAFVAGRADVLIVSKTPYEDICNWLERHGLLPYVTAVAGKEQGGKDEHICLARGGAFDARQRRVTQAGELYPPERVIMGGDGGGDLKAAKANGAFFFPTPPGRETEAWADAVDAVFQPFFDGAYAAGEPARLAEFENAMQTAAPWEKSDYDHAAAYAVLQPRRRELYDRLNPGGTLA
ncbi:MAG: HAD family hydrolase [Lentisphaerae bacterium]|nr:HAD family hydrolase [Lentisphaerota bacterium]